MKTRLKLGETILFDGKAFIVNSTVGDGYHIVRRDNPKDTHDLSQADLARLRSERRLFLEVRRDVLPIHVREACEHAIEAFTAEEQGRMRQATPYVRACDNVGGRLRLSKKFLEPLIEGIAKETGDAKPPSWNSVRRWYNLYIGAGRDIRALIPAFRTRGNRHQRYPAWVHDTASVTIENFYLRAERPTVAAAFAVFLDTLKARAEREGVVVPEISRAFFYRKVAALDEYTKLFHRHGKRAADMALLPVGKGPQGERPLDQVEVDATRLDVELIHDHVDILLGRPWLVVMLDRRTRCILGFFLSYDPPSWLSVMQCLVHSILPKDEELKKLGGILNPWPCQGPGEEYITDNGKEYLSASMTEGMYRLGARHTLLPRRSPWLKGKIERWFRSLEGEVIHWVPGTTFSSPGDRGEYQSQKMAVLRVSQLRWLITKWICDVYHVRVHRTTGRAPLHHWQQEVETFGARPTPDPRLLVPLVGQIVRRTLRVTGIEYEGLHYNSMEIAILRNRSKKDMAAEVHVKIDPSDISKVWVHDAASGEWSEIPCTDPEYVRGLSLHQHRLIKRRAAELAGVGNLVATGNLHAAKAEMVRVVEDLLKSARKSGVPRRLARLMEQAGKPSSYIEASKFDPGASETPLADQTASGDRLASEEVIQDPAEQAQNDATFDPAQYSSDNLDKLVLDIGADDEGTFSISGDKTNGKLPDFEDL